MLFTKSPIEDKLDGEMMSVLKEMNALKKTDEKYATLVERLAKLHKLKSEDRPKFISPDTALTVAANIFTVLWIARYEKDNFINTKALSFTSKLR